MTQDFAKQRRTKQPEKPQGKPGWFLFVAGFFCGAFIAILAGLWLLSPDSSPGEASIEKPSAEPKAKTDDMQWDFYEIFPKSVVPIAEQYDGTTDPQAADNRQWVLQAGSFKNPNDADERRAELLLMGLSASTASVDMQGTTWHRVIVGPFDTDLEKNRAQDKLAQAQIQSIPMKVAPIGE